MAGRKIQDIPEIDPNDKSIDQSLKFLDYVFESCPLHDFRVRLWDGTTWGHTNPPRFTLVLKHPGALRKMFLQSSELALGESYIFNDFDIEGDIEASFAAADFLLSEKRSLKKNLYLATLLRGLPATGRPRAVPRQICLHGAAHSTGRDREAISYHYDLPPGFFALFLDPKMVYSCAYFHSREEPLKVAQERKLDYICRKLRLRPGERLLDIGCGWGGLITYASTHYGVRSLGVTLSAEQADFARQRIREAALDDLCRVELRDYREIKARGQFDKIASVGMFEHVGEALLPKYFKKVHGLLRPQGAFLNHGIACSATYLRQGPSFITSYVFPDGELVPIHTTVKTAELSGFEVRDVENLREHYALTLHRWIEMLQKHAAEARRLTDDTIYRIWRLYMAGSAHAFRTARLGLYQTLLVKPKTGEAALPLTREDWYRSAEDDELQHGATRGNERGRSLSRSQI